MLRNTGRHRILTAPGRWVCRQKRRCLTSPSPAILLRPSQGRSISSSRSLGGRAGVSTQDFNTEARPREGVMA